MSPSGGIAVFISFLGKISFVEAVRQHMPVRWRKPNHIDPTSTFTEFLVSVLLGARRIAHASLMRGDRVLHALMALLACACSIYAQPGKSYLIDTFAGTAPYDEGIPAVSALLNPSALTVAPDGSVYVIDTTKGVRKIGPDGTISSVSGAFGSSAVAIAVNRAGALYYIGGPELYFYDPASSSVTTSRPSFGPASGHIFTGVAVDQEGNAIIADRQSRQIYRVSPSGLVAIVAGLYSGVELTGLPLRVAVDATNTIYVLQSDNRIVRISPGLITPIAGNGQFGTPAVGGRASDSGFGSMTALAVSASGELYLADSRYQSIYKVDQAGVLQIVAQNVCVLDMAVNDMGVVFFADPCAAKIQRVDSEGSIRVFAGRNQFDGDGGPARNALLWSPAAVVVDAAGSVLIGDTGNNRIRKVSPAGLIETIAGTGQPGNAGDGLPALDAQIAGPGLLAIDSEQNVYFTARGWLQVRRIRSDGIVETVAGSGNSGNSGDGGPATAATFRSIDGLAVDRDGRVFISDSISNRIRVVNRDGTIEPYAGNGQYDSADDGALAIDAGLTRPTRLAIDPEGNLVFFENGFLFKFRRVEKSGIITTYPFGWPGDDSARCSFTEVTGLAFDVDGSLLVLGGNLLCRLQPDGVSWWIAGSRPGYEFAGDGGPATLATFSGASSLAVDLKGSIFIADAGNRRIRKLTPLAP